MNEHLEPKLNQGFLKIRAAKAALNNMAIQKDFNRTTFSTLEIKKHA